MQSDEGSVIGDVTLVVEGEEVTCQRHDLQQASHFFRGMFNSQMLESRADKIPIKDVSPDIFAILVRNAGTGELSLDPSNVYDVLAAASQFQFPDIIVACEEYLTAELNIDNCLPTMYIAEMCALNKLFQKAKSQTLWYFGDVINTESFFSLSLTSVREYLSERMLNIESELQVFEAVVKWTQHDDGANRCDHFTDLLDVVELQCLSDGELKHVASCELVKHNDACKQRVESLLASGARQPVRQRGVPQELWILGGRGHESSVRQFNTNTGEFTTVGHLPSALVMEELIGHAVCVLGKDLYLLGGERQLGRGKWQPNVWKYDSLADQWSVFGQIPHKCRHHTALASGHYIYLIGGVDKFRVHLASVHRLDTLTGEWSKLPDMHHSVYAASACTLNGKLYVFKQYSEVYTPRSNTWYKVNMPRGYLRELDGVFVYQDKIYFIAASRAQLVEFDTERETFTELKFTGLDTVHSVAVHKHRLCIFGCKDEVDMFTECDLSDIQQQCVGSSTIKLQCEVGGTHRAVFLPRFPDFTQLKMKQLKVAETS